MALVSVGQHGCLGPILRTHTKCRRAPLGPIDKSIATALAEQVIMRSGAFEDGQSIARLPGDTQGLPLTVTSPASPLDFSPFAARADLALSVRQI